MIRFLSSLSGSSFLGTFCSDNQGWIPDLTQCGDVESNPGPTWNEIREQVIARVGPKTEKARSKLDEALGRFEDTIADFFPDVPFLTDRDVKTFLSAPKQRRSLPENLVYLVEEIIGKSRGIDCFTLSSHSLVEDSFLSFLCS